jgi:hypothetical protein
MPPSTESNAVFRLNRFGSMPSVEGRIYCTRTCRPRLPSRAPATHVPTPHSRPTVPIASRVPMASRHRIAERRRPVAIPRPDCQRGLTQTSTRAPPNDSPNPFQKRARKQVAHPTASALGMIPPLAVPDHSRDAGHRLSESSSARARLKR